MRISDWSSDVCSSDLAAIDTGVDDVKAPAVVADRRGEQSARDADLADRQLAWAVDGVTDLAPVDQVAAVIDRQAGKPAEGRIDQIIVVADTSDRWVGLETGQHRIGEIAGSGGPRLGKIGRAHV